MGTGFDTIPDAKRYLRDHFDEGASCPCCGQYVKLYRRTITSRMARHLIAFYKLGGGYGWHHTRDLGVHGGDFTKFQYWQLIEGAENDDSEKRCSGLWRLTDAGRLFVAGKLEVRKFALVFDGRLYGFEGDKITIQDALGEKFDYSVLMGPVQTKLF